MVIGPGANFFCAPKARAHTRTRTDTHTHTRTHAKPLERTANAGVDWPSGVPGFFLVGRSIMGRWTAVFYFILFIYLSIYSFIHSFILLCLDVSLSIPREGEIGEKSN